jgi:hypothetical protein
MSERYQGWTNNETWRVALWLGNEEGSYNWCREVARECWGEVEAEKPFTRAEKATFAMAEWLKEEFEEGNPLKEKGATVYSDLLWAALSEVNWHEIAGHYIEEVAEAENEPVLEAPGDVEDE